MNPIPNSLFVIFSGSGQVSVILVALSFILHLILVKL